MKNIKLNQFTLKICLKNVKEIERVGNNYWDNETRKKIKKLN